jgi:hypothetical protein
VAIYVVFNEIRTPHGTTVAGIACFVHVSLDTWATTPVKFISKTPSGYWVVPRFRCCVSKVPQYIYKYIYTVKLVNTDSSETRNLVQTDWAGRSRIRHYINSYRNSSINRSLCIPDTGRIILSQFYVYSVIEFVETGLDMDSCTRGMTQVLHNKADGQNWTSLTESHDTSWHKNKHNEQRSTHSRRFTNTPCNNVQLLLVWVISISWQYMYLQNTSMHQTGVNDDSHRCE